MAIADDQVITCGEVKQYWCGRTEEIDDEYCSVALSGEQDMIVVRDELQPPVPVIARYCGDLDDVTVTSSGDTLLVEFDSDGRLEGPGFAAHYSFAEPRLPVPPTDDRPESDRQPTKRPNIAGKYRSPSC